MQSFNIVDAGVTVSLVGRSAVFISHYYVIYLNITNAFYKHLAGQRRQSAPEIFDSLTFKVGGVWRAYGTNRLTRANFFFISKRIKTYQNANIDRDPEDHEVAGTTSKHFFTKSAHRFEYLVCTIVQTHCSLYITYLINVEVGKRAQLNLHTSFHLNKSHEKEIGCNYAPYAR